MSNLSVNTTIASFNSDIALRISALSQDDLYSIHTATKIGKPKLTVILYATPESILARLKKRDINDSDIAKVSKSEKAYERMIYFCETKKLEYIVIDTSNKTPEETVDLIMKRIEELK